jgi:hypothetical protein
MPKDCDPEFTSKVASFNNVKSYINIFSMFSLIKNTCYVSHGKILSQYNILENNWMSHYTYKEPILSLFRASVKGQFQACLMLKNGDIYNDIYTPD